MCVFCKIVSGEAAARIVFQDEDVLAFHDVNPQAPTHVLVIPRRHVVSLADTEDGDTELLGKLMQCARRVAEMLDLVKSGYRVVINNGAGAGQSVFHLHVHVIGGRRMRWPPG
ncbi:MAG: histidine triad nucleotide-binding protein [Deltaproteobacteria bacterium]|nr:histidine triad nucleotide-binding protein [Deltaproteobacteria bacterium]